MLIGALLWLVTMLLTAVGYWFSAMLVGAFVFLPYFIAGVAHNRKISAKIIVYPAILCVVIRLIGYIGAEYYSESFMGKAPDFLVTGFHPSFGFIFWCFWIGGLLTITLGFGIMYREYLPAGAWDEFLEKLEKKREEVE